MAINVDLYSIELINSMEFKGEYELVGKNQYIAEYLKNTLKEKGVCYVNNVSSDNIYEDFIKLYPEESIVRLDSLLSNFKFIYNKIPINYQCSTEEWFHSFAYLNTEQYADSIQKLLDVDIGIKEKVELFFNVFTFNSDENSIYFLINIFNIMKSEVDDTGKKYLQHMINYLVMYYMKIFQYVDKSKNILQYYSDINISFNKSDFVNSVLKPFNLNIENINYLVKHIDSEDLSKENKIIRDCVKLCTNLTIDYGNKNHIQKCFALVKFVFDYVRKHTIQYKWYNNNPYIERIIQFLENTINDYLSADMHPIIYWRVISLIYLKNSLKFRYNLDNKIYDNKEIVYDYLKELKHIIDKKYYTTNVVIYSKILEMITQVQTFSNHSNLDININLLYHQLFDEFTSNLTFDSLRFLDHAFNICDFDFKKNQELAMSFFNVVFLPKNPDYNVVFKEMKSYAENFLERKKGLNYQEENIKENKYNFSYIY